ncbi:TolC family protein [Massilia phyllosphaerae]|uniref:TolC family protein n=1 Tax=Massilia phyllosphaerae TaxID=3106034 RepID=UPI002B1CB7F6|nr:TolC family protein [Massilia sp. SGZ-792]
MPIPSKRFIVVASLCALITLTGCATTHTHPLSAADVASTIAADRARAQQGVEPLQGPLSFDEAVARAIKYNLDRRARALEVALAQGQLDAGAYDALPKLMADAGYRYRNNDLITRSIDSVTGQPSLANPFISSDRVATTYDLTFTWSLLDFGQSYYAAQQNGDKVLIAAERRRKAMHLLIQDVRTAFWRTASAQKLRGDVEASIIVAEEALADSRQAEAERLRNPVDALRYQRQLLENLRLLEAIDQELSSAKVELAALINLPLTQNIVVQEAEEKSGAEWLAIPIEKMEELALANNPDLRESMYNARVASVETRRTLLKLFPGLSFNYGRRHSNDSYLIYQNWNEAGLQVSYNLLGLLSAPAQKRLAEAGVALADQRRVATQMAVLAQVHLARLQYQNALRQLDRADAIWKVDSEIARHAANRGEVQAQSKLDVVANRTTVLLSHLRRYQALAQAQATAGKLQATLGLEPMLGMADDAPLADLTRAVSASMRVNPTQANP